MSISSGDIIYLCGIAYLDTYAGGEKFGAALTYFNCDNYSSGEFSTFYLTSNDSFYYGDGFVCFELVYTANGTEGIDACNSYFVVGLNSQTSGLSSIKFSYSLHVVRTCPS